MAEGEWVPAFVSLWKGPKAARLAAELWPVDERRPHRARSTIEPQARHAAGGLFLELLGWALNACESGDLGSVEPAVLAVAVGWGATRELTLEAQGRALLEALKRARLVSDDDRAHVTGWDDGPGKLIARRAYERERKRVRRGAEGAQKGRNGGASAPLSPGHEGSVPRDRPRVLEGSRPTAATRPGDAGALSHGRAEERREEKNPPTPQQVPRDRLASAGGVLVDREAAAAVLVESATEPWRSALERFQQAHGTAALVTWFAGSALEVRDGLGTLTLVNEFAASFVGDKFAQELRQGLGLTGLEVVARRRAMGEPGVIA